MDRTKHFDKSVTNWRAALSGIDRSRSGKLPRARRTVTVMTVFLGTGTLSLAAAALPAAQAATSAQVLRMLPARQLGLAGSTRARTSSSSQSTSPCWASSNWSGYAVSQKSVQGLPCVPASGETYTSVSGTWTVPTVSPSIFPTYSSAWTGIDGFSNDNLIQAGTEQDYYNGAAHYSAWWEILPAAETVIPSVKVSPGNSITVTITKGAGSSWAIALLNDTTGASFSTDQTYNGSGASAEWILEAPEVNGHVATLADYSVGGGPDIFSAAAANGVSPGLVAGTGGEMVQGSFFFSKVVSSPSSPVPAGNEFAVAYGSTAPAVP